MKEFKPGWYISAKEIIYVDRMEFSRFLSQPNAYFIKLWGAPYYTLVCTPEQFNDIELFSAKDATKLERLIYGIDDAKIK